MAEIEPEKQSAKQYDDRTTTAVKRALVEIGQILGSYQGQFAVVGGSVPALLIKNEEMGHVGTADIDLGLDPEALGEGEYAKLVKTMVDHGYVHRKGLRRFQLVRKVDPKDGGEPIDVVVDFLMPRNAAFVKNVPPLVDDFAVIRAEGAELALQFQELVAIEAEMPDGGVNRVEIAVASIPALLAMKGHALAKREKRKDAYDIYYCVLNYAGGLGALAADCQPLLGYENGMKGFQYINEKFTSVGHIGPLWVREFVIDSPVQGDRTPDQWQQDAFGQVDAWLRALGIRN